MPSIGLTCVHVSLNARCGERVTNQRFRGERRKTCTGMCGKSPLVTTASESLVHFCAFGVFDIVLLFCGFVCFLSLAVVSHSQVVSCLVIAPSVIPSCVLSLSGMWHWFLSSSPSEHELTYVDQPSALHHVVSVVAPSANPMRTDHCWRFPFQCTHVPRQISSSASRVLLIYTQTP